MKAAVALAFLGASVGAINVDFTSKASIKDGASTIAHGLMKYYNGNETGQVPGSLPHEYYWWETGALFTAVIDYWAQTGDDTYNAVTTQGLLHQVGEHNDFMPTNQTTTEASDDQGVWALAAMAAAEKGFPSPPKDAPKWQDLAENVFNDFVRRWDVKTCGGGLRWQIFPFNAGYNVKNSGSNGVFFDLAARLYMQTKNSTYSKWASDIFEWEQRAGLISESYQVFQTLSTENCDEIDKIQTSMDAGIFLHGSAVMYNATSSMAWKTRADGLLKGVRNAFVDDGILVESACASRATCSNDLRAYKGFLIRSLKDTTQLAPYTGAVIQPLLLTNAKAAAKACSGSPERRVAGTACGFSWTGGAYDGLTGVGEQMNALSALSAVVSMISGSGSNATITVGPPKPSSTSEQGPATTTASPKNSGSRVDVTAVSAMVVLSGVLYSLL
ncbi:glycoside hydrolase family 76 protein [Trichoderma barbatum]